MYAYAIWLHRHLGRVWAADERPALTVCRPALMDRRFPEVD